jgi:DNA invertase Pin-like site-specific DNA recombinase
MALATDSVAPRGPAGAVAIGYVYLNTSIPTPVDGTLADQRRTIERFAVAQGLTLETVIQETSDSISTRHQPQLERWIRGDSGVQWDVLVVARLDRLSRQVRQLKAILSGIHDPAHRHLISVEEGIDTRTGDGQFCLKLIEIFSAWEAVAVPDRTREWIAKKRQNGEPMGHAPFGYTYESKNLVESPQEKQVVRTIQELRATQLSYQKIARYLNAQKIPSKRGGSWYPETVKAVYSRGFSIKDAPGD